MRLHELYQTNQSSINEAPVGAFKRGALKIGKAFGGAQSAGELDTANDANSLYKEFQQYLGRAGIKQPTAKDVRLFLQKKAISPKAVAKAMDDVVITKGQQELDFGPEFEKPKDSKRASEVVDSLKGLGADALANLKKIAQVELKQRKNPPRWVEVIAEPGEDKTEHIAAIHAAGNKVILNTIIEAPKPEPEILPPEYQQIAEDTARQKALEDEQYDQALRESRRPQRRLLPPEERPFSLDYPKQVF